MSPWAYWPSLLSSLVRYLLSNKSRQGPAIETSQDMISKAIVSIPKSVYDKVGPGSSELQVTKTGNKT